jgi:hypothetical protein
LLINKPQSIIYSLTRGVKLSPAYDFNLLYVFSKIFLKLFNVFKDVHTNPKALTRSRTQKNILKLFYLPIYTNSISYKSPIFSYNPLHNTFFFKNYSNNITRIFYLFYDLGFLKKKVIFFSMKKNFVNIANLVTYSIFNNHYPVMFLKILYIMTKKRVKTRKKKLKKILNRFKAYAIFFLSLPKSKKFLRYIQSTNLITIGLSNSNLFELNVPIINNWLTYKFLYLHQVYEYYRLGAYNHQLITFKNISYKLNYLYNVFFLKKN